MIFMKSGYYYLIVAEEKNEREREIQVLHDALALTNKLLENWQRKKEDSRLGFTPKEQSITNEIQDDEICKLMH